MIGGGSGGYAAARTAVSLGLSTIVIEGGEEVGGLCILRGCMPSKALIESANRFRTLRHAAEFGLNAAGKKGSEKRVSPAHDAFFDFEEAIKRRGRSLVLTLF